MSTSSVAASSAVKSKQDSPNNSLWNDAVRRLKKNKAAVYSGYFIILICVVSFCAQWLAPFSFDTQDIGRMLLPPNSTNWLGTDSLGRDLLSRLIYGGRVSMSVGIITAIISLIVGAIYGAISGWFGGKIDSVLMRFIDILFAIPDIVLLILIMIAFEAVPIGNSELKAVIAIIVALSATGWAGIARLVRGQILQTKQMLYIEAATALGARATTIIFRHIMPNILGPIIVSLSFQIPANVLAESFLSFIGLGLQPPHSSWGSLAAEGWRSLKTYPHLMIYPGFALFLSMLAFNLFGDGLRDAFDPKMKNR